MTEATVKPQDEDPQICSVDSLRKLCEKHPKMLLISAKEDRREFIQKFTEATPKDLTVAGLEMGGSCEIIEKLGMKDTPTAVLIEKGEVKARITLQNDDVKDAIGLIKMLSECASCKAELLIDKKGWKLKPEPTRQCSLTLSNLEKLRPEVKNYFEKHIESEG